MQFASLGSGSKGNSTLVRAGDTLVMIDCGFSVRETVRRLARLNVEPRQLDAILVTHEHSDHSSGVAALSRKFEVPVYLTHGTFSTGRCDGSADLRCFNCEDDFTIGCLSVKAVAVPHDAAEPCQYRLGWKDYSLGILTDLGSITPHVAPPPTRAPILIDNASKAHAASPTCKPLTAMRWPSPARRSAARSEGGSALRTPSAAATTKLAAGSPRVRAQARCRCSATQPQ